MRILYAIQGTGNGHTSRAIEIIPILLHKAEVDVLISGTQADLELPFTVKYQYKGLGFIFGKDGGIAYLQTLKNTNLFSFINEVRKCPVQDYDLVINDFEPISAWACKLKGTTCISLSHQSALLGANIPQIKEKNWFAMKVLKYYAPSQENFGFHFKKYNRNLFTPIIRNNIRNAEVKTKKHYTVYLPAYSDEKIIHFLSKFPKIKWQVFSKESKKPYSKKNVFVRPIETYAFEKSMATCTGVLCGAGFETPAEALFLKKKLLVIPMKGQYEQQLNAAALKEMGVTVLQKLNKKHYYEFVKWIASKKIVQVQYPNHTHRILSLILEKYNIVKQADYQISRELML